MESSMDRRGQPPESDGERSPLLTPLQGQSTTPQKKRRNLLATRKGALFSGLILLLLLGLGLGVMVLRASSVTQQWVFHTNSPMFSPAVANGLVYAASMDGKLHAVDAQSGQEKWSFSTGSPNYVAMTVAHGIVYANTTEGKVYAFDARLGSQKWTYQAKDVILYATPVVVNSMLYLVTS